MVRPARRRCHDALLAGPGPTLGPSGLGRHGRRAWQSLRAVSPGRGWLLVSADCPGLDAALLEGAATHVARGDLVLGPTLDGGYYLLGGVAPLPDLFSAMPWGSGRVLGETRARLARAACVWHELATLRGVETAADARAEGLLT